MTRRQHIVGIALTALLVSAARAAGDPLPLPPDPPAYPDAPPFAHLNSPRLACLALEPTPDCIQLHPGYYLDEPTWARLDAETKRLQDAETRLTVENKSMRKSLDGWQPGWYTIAGFVAGGIVLGWYAHDKL